ncbi:MAG: hypothetical protein AAF685_06460 [Cyanobacteria bacterium P01_C01_bin.89]
MIDRPTLIARAAKDPKQHLGRRSLKLLHSYLTGYDRACLSLQIPTPHDPLDHELFQNWVYEKLGGRFSVSAFCYAELVSADESEALDTYIAFRKEVLSQVGSQPAPAPVLTPDVSAINVFGDLVRIHKRPAMYFGNHWSLTNLWAYFRGYIWFERDCGVELSKNVQVLNGFQQWMETRYPFGAGVPWDRIMHFSSLGSPKISMDSFIKHLDEYQRSQPDSAMDPKSKEIIANILSAKESEQT